MNDALKIPPENFIRPEPEAKSNRAEMTLQQLRELKQVSQVELAKLLLTTQPNISRIERRTDIHISTLQRYIKAMGGKLQIVAHMPGLEVFLKPFRDGL